MSEIEPWLTIVVPAYNSERFLGACVASIDPARHDDVQVVLVDDGSTDFTSSLCDELSNAHENVDVVHKLNGGLPSARNAGLSRAEGHWVWFVDSDDLIAPHALDVLKPLVLETDADAIYISLEPFSGVEEPVWPLAASSTTPEHLSSDEFISGWYRGLYQHYMPSSLLRTDALRAWSDCTAPSRGRRFSAGPFREDFSLYEDVVSAEEFFRRISRVDVLSAKLYGYRQVSASMTHRRSDSAADSGLRAVRDLQRYQVALDVADDKMRMEIGLLFSAYKLVEEGEGSKPLKREIREEIELRVARVGVTHLGPARLGRYALMRVGLLDLIISLRSRG